MIVVALLLSGCATTCGATADKLAALRRGMTYAETAGIMGCRGMPGDLRPAGAGEVSAFEWRGPGTIFTVTQIDFRDDQLLYYVVRAMGGL